MVIINLWLFLGADFLLSVMLFYLEDFLTFMVCLALGLMLKCFATHTATETQAVNSCKLGYFDIKGE